MPEGSPSALHQGPMGEESLQSSMPLCNSEHDQTNADLGPDCYSRLCEEPLDAETERPVSLVSTLSSDSSSRDSRSLFGSTITLPVSTTPPLPCGEDIDLELSPAEGQAGDHSPYTASTRNHWLERLESKGISSQWNKNNDVSNRKASPEIPHIHASPVVTSAMAPNPNLTYADRVVMELIETERMYVKDLSSIVEDYLAHIIDINNLPIQPEQVCALFGNIEDIYEFNSELLQSLDMCDNDPVAIAKCFVDKSEYFEIYTQYCTNYPNSVAALTECMRNKTLAKFFRDRQAALKRSLPLGSFLLKPVQRILKYHLLLQEIAKHFDPDEEGYEVVQEAIDTMTSVAWYINDMKRKHEHAVRVQEIQSLLINWKGPDLTTYGELVLEGTFHVLRAKNTRTLFLFERMLLITKKRGEHYVYKIHISCSTLMLLDSGKDPLLFSVIHFKHPKQPHTVQAKSVEEKRLWAHHIKRLILENHSTIVPQKAKDAMLDNSNYLGKHQYSPERLIKADSCQTEDFNLGRRKGRRRSEPSKQIMGNTKAALKHADSEGALMGDRRSLQPATSVSTLASSLGRPQAGVSYEDSQTPRKDSLQQRSSADSGLKPGSSPSEGGRELEQAEKAKRDDEDEEQEEEEEEQEEEEEGDSYKEDVLMGDDQVADFANSVLAAISCWHYRARALLSTHFTTDNHDTDVTEEKVVLKDQSETYLEVDEPVDVKETLTTQINMEERCPPDAVPQEEKSEQLEVSLSPGSPVASPQLETEPSESQETSRETVEEEEEAESDSSHFPVEETIAITNGELSEEEEVLDCGRILPSSMLDQASARAERFAASLSRRSSLVSEDLGSLACPSPTAECEVFQSPSACMDFEKQTQMMDSSSPEPQTNSELTPVHLSTPVGKSPLDALAEGERRSTLSKKDRLLIHKIRRYYEHAEHQDAAFSIKRRESLSYIPAGLVRHLSQQLNSVPQEQAVAVHKKSPSRNRPTSWSIFDLPGLEKCRNSESRRSGETQRAVEVRTRSQSVTDTSTAEEEFRPSAEILKVLQDMEIEEEGLGLGQEGLQDDDEKVDESSLEETEDISSDAFDNQTADQSIQILKESEMCSASDSSSVSSPTTASPPAEVRSAVDTKPSKSPVSPEKCHFSHSKLPNIISFRSSMDEDQILQDMGKMKNKVFQLARQYSQRIKNNRPMVWQRNRDAANQQGCNSASAGHEEKAHPRRKGKLNLRLPLTTCDEMVIHEVHSPSPVQSPSSVSNCQLSVPCPQSPQSQAFHWPDVQGLCSKYTSPSSLSTGGRSCAALMSGCCRDRCNACSQKCSSSLDLHRALSKTDPDRHLLEDWPQRRRTPLQPLLCRWNSLDHMLGSVPLHEAQDLRTPAKNCCTGYNLHNWDRHFPEDDMDCAEKSGVLTLGKMSDSNIVKSLREKFQSLGTNS